MKSSLVSAAIHVIIVVLIMVRTATVDAYPKPAEHPTMVTYRPPPATPHEPGPPHPGHGGLGPPPNATPIPPTFPPDVPPISAATPGPTPITLDTTWGPSRTPFDARGTGGESPSGVLSADIVDVQVTPYPGAPTPRYPETLRAAGVEGEVTLEFVVDTSGRVEGGSVHTISSTAAAFVVSVSDALAATRYHPALVRGRPVRQLVRQQFVFSLTPH